MATTTSSTTIPQDIVDAIEHDGELTNEQFIRLITAEAAMLGLTFDEAVAAARNNTLPWNAVGMELRDLINVLEYSPACDIRQ